MTGDAIGNGVALTIVLRCVGLGAESWPSMRAARLAGSCRSMIVQPGVLPSIDRAAGKQSVVRIGQLAAMASSTTAGNPS